MLMIPFAGQLLLHSGLAEHSVQNPYTVMHVRMCTTTPASMHSCLSGLLLCISGGCEHATHPCWGHVTVLLLLLLTCSFPCAGWPIHCAAGDETVQAATRRLLEADPVKMPPAGMLPQERAALDKYLAQPGECYQSFVDYDYGLGSKAKGV